MYLTHRQRLYPTEHQEQKFIKFAGTARWAYNECLSYKIDCYKNYNYSCGLKDMMKHIQELKNSEEYKWLQEIPEAITKQSIKDLNIAYKNFFERGNKGFPKFKSKNKNKLSFYQRTDNLKSKMIDGNVYIKITGIKKWVKTKEPLKTDRPQNPRVIYDNKYWYLTYSYEVDALPKSMSTEVIGVDLGVKNLAVTSNNKVYKNINKTERVKKLEKKLHRLQRKLSKKYEINKQGNRFVKTNNIIKLENQIKIVYRTLSNIRKTYLHEVTKDLVRTKPKAICIEDLDICGMMKNRYLSKAIAEQEFYRFRTYLEYKCKLNGIDLIIADRYYPSSKTMSCCGYKFNKLSLSTRILKCPQCNTIIDRDLNAAINLKNYALAY